MSDGLIEQKPSYLKVLHKTHLLELFVEHFADRVRGLDLSCKYRSKHVSQGHHTQNQPAERKPNTTVTQSSLNCGVIQF